MSFRARAFRASLLLLPTLAGCPAPVASPADVGGAVDAWAPDSGPRMDGSAAPDGGSVPDGSTEPDGGTSDGGATPDASTVPDASMSSTIGPAGGSVSAGEAEVTIPAGALSTDVAIGVAAVAAPLALPPEYTAVSLFWAFTPHGTTFATPATIQIQHAGGADAVLHLDSPSDTAWDLVASPSLDATRASFTTSTFSFYVVVHRVATTAAVRPFYASAPLWNDYVVNDGPTGLAATGTVCTSAMASAAQLHNHCIHGGEMRAVDVPGHTSCAGLAATDDLGAFDWACVVQAGQAVMVSTHLHEDVRLATLIDFTTLAWRENTVSVTDGGTGLFTTPAERWWANPIAADDDGGIIGSAATAGTIFVVRASPTADYVLSADRIGLVVQPGQHLGPPTGSSMGLVRTPGSASVFGAWIEGDIVGGGSTLRLVQSVIRHVHFSASHLLLTYTMATRVEHLEGTCVADGVGTVNDILLSIDFFSFGDRVRDLRAARCATGLSVQGGRHVVEGVLAFSGRVGVGAGGGANVLADLTTVHNEQNGVIQQGANAMLHVTTAHNRGDGIQLTGSFDPSVVLGVMSTQNSQAGFGMSGSTPGVDEDVWDVVSYANVWFGYFFGTRPAGGFPWISFHGRFGTGQTGNAPPTMWWGAQSCYFPMPNGFRSGDCAGSRATTATPGADGLRSQSVAPYSCELDTNSDASYLPLSGGGGFFPTRVPPFDEPANTSDVNGVREFASVTDWFGFAGPYRAWGAEGSATPNCLAQGPCDATAVGTRGCQIYDYTLIGMADEFVCARSMPVPTGDDVVTWDVAIGGPHGFLADDAACMATFSQATILPPSGARTYSLCHVTFLHLARELEGDLVGNDNVLCESGETCVFTPNIASYQGDGPFITAGTFVDGTIHGVTMLRYTTNGVSSPFRP